MAGDFLVTQIRVDEARLRELINDEEGPAAADLLRRADAIQRTAARLAPVATGRLQASIRTGLGRDGQGLYAVIGSNVPYAIYQELGTSRMPAHPFLRPAVAAAADGGL